MKTELDSRATARYVTTDDLLRKSPPLARWRPAVGIAPRLSDAELVTLAMMQAMSWGRPPSESLTWPTTGAEGDAGRADVETGRRGPP
ncbi:hypothetical protein ABZV14_16915 [Streptosporangium canum]